MKPKNMGDSLLVVDVLRAHFGDSNGSIHTGVEVGTHRGATAARLLAEFPGLVLFCVDPYAEYPEDHPYRKSGDGIASLSAQEQEANYRAAKEATSFALCRVLFIRRPSPEAVRYIPAPRFSFVFLDGAHHYEAVRDDIAAWWPRVEAGGVLCGHDLGHPRDGKKFGVKRAVEEFCEANKLAYDCIGSVWFIVRPGIQAPHDVPQQPQIPDALG